MHQNMYQNLHTWSWCFSFLPLYRDNMEFNEGKNIKIPDILIYIYMHLKILNPTHVLIVNDFTFKILNTFFLNSACFSITLTCLPNLLKLYMCQKNSISFWLTSPVLKYFSFFLLTVIIYLVYLVRIDTFKTALTPSSH